MCMLHVAYACGYSLSKSASALQPSHTTLNVVTFVIDQGPHCDINMMS